MTGALAAAVPGASAVPAASKSDTRVASVAKASTLTTGRYVVVLSEPGATRYDSRTTPAYLTKRQNGVAHSVGAE